MLVDKAIEPSTPVGKLIEPTSKSAVGAVSGSTAVLLTRGCDVQGRGQHYLLGSSYGCWNQWLFD